MIKGSFRIKKERNRGGEKNRPKTLEQLLAVKSNQETVEAGLSRLSWPKKFTLTIWNPKISCTGKLTFCI